MIVLLLLITTLKMSGQFVVLTFMGPLPAKLAGADPDAIGLVFACYGVCGFIGVAIATRIVDSFGAWKTSVLFTFSVSVIMSEPNSGLKAGSGLWRSVDTLTWMPSSLSAQL